jgi:hypothetical protein
VLLALGALGAAAHLRAADPTVEFTLGDGQTTQTGALTFGASGGFRGYKKGVDDKGESFMLVREGAAPDDYATLVFTREPGAASGLEKKRAFGEAFAYASLGMTAEELARKDWAIRGTPNPENHWVVNGVSFFYVILDGAGANAGRCWALAAATVGDDFVSVDLQAPASMCEQSLQGMKSFVLALKFPAQNS